LSPKAAPAGARVRAAAAEIVARVLEERRSADELLAAADNVAPRDRGLLAALVLGALRWHHRLDWQAARLLTRPLEREQAALAALLRIGLLQLEELRIPPHAAVSATVDAAGLIGARAAAPLVNAVLRRYQRERGRLVAEEPLEARLAHPAWIIEALRADYPEHWLEILAANNELPPLWLRVNRLRATREEYLAKLAAAGVEATPSAQVASAVRLAAPVAVDVLPGFRAGEVSVQDVAAQRAAELLELAPGQRVLDACAAPGGKTGHILELTAGRSEVWAVDRDARRLELVRENLVRLALRATLVAGDATAPQSWWDGKPFDRILLDAPCSALGVIRRHPDIKVVRTPDDVERAVALQGALLRALWPLLAPGGLLVYATCSVLKRENDEQIQAFRRDEPTIAADSRDVASSLQLLPGEAAGDGFYYAWLRKPQPP
jgi:16S rRNA (cytosine967-C5)-methyltransferase